MQILIVDDSKAMRTIIKRSLRQAGFEGLDVLEAGNGREALEVTKNACPALVLADWNMPELNGMQLLEELRGQGSTVHFGFITSESSPEMKQKALDAGAAFLISKPFTADSIREVLAGYIG